MPVEKISIEGLSEFTRALRKLDADLPKMVRVSNNTVANYFIDKIRPQIPYVSGAARISLKAQSTRTSARIRVGGPKAPYYPWLDFGGQGRIMGRPAAREFIKEGRYVYPTLRRYSPEIAKMQYEAMKDIARAAGLDVK